MRRNEQFACHLPATYPPLACHGVGCMGQNGMGWGKKDKNETKRNEMK
jgi:hypothetical protein